MWWNDAVEVLPTYRSANIIALQIQDDIRVVWFIVFLYGHPSVSRRGEVWCQVESQINRFQHPFIIIGDFNHAEKLSLSG